MGGMIGSLLRYFVSLSTNHFNNGFPAGTLLANLAGSFFLGWFTSRVIARNKLNPLLAGAIGTGLTGSFTTFSTFSVETLILIESGKMGLAIFYVLISAIGGFLLAAVGYKIGLGQQGRKEGRM